MILKLSETTKALRACIPRVLYLKARRELQSQHRIAVYHRACAECGTFVLKAQMPGPCMKVCKACWDSLMDLYSCNQWAVVRKSL